MDRKLDSSVTRRRIMRRSAAGVAVAAALVAVYALAAALITPSLARARVRTAVVDRGPVESVTSAAGTVVPEVEQVVSSPIDARVVRILKRPGDALKKGDPIVTLDTSATSLAIDKVDQQIALKANAQESVRLELEKTLKDLESQIAAKRLDLDSLEAQLERDRKLASAGLLSATSVRDSELRAQKARIELAQLDAEIANARAATKTKLEGLALEMESLRKDRAEAAHQLDLATMTSDRDGVLTWVIAEEGATVAHGAVIARVADLGSFRVDATISDVHAQEMAAGLPVKVRIDEAYLDGTVAGVLPTIQNGTMTITVALANPADPRLRANLRVDVFVVTDRRADALRLRKGPYANAAGEYDVFVVRGDRAVRTKVRLGISGVDEYEVAEGLEPGDEVIISDMRDYARASEVLLR
jgi:HlyD family secretion protein